MMSNLLTSEDDETLMRSTLRKCYGKKRLAFRVSREHYLYLAEQIISLREDARRRANNLFPYNDANRQLKQDVELTDERQRTCYQGIA